MPDASNSPAWFYRKEGRDFGPLPEDDLKFLHRAGLLGAGAMVRRDGSTEWIEVEPVELADRGAAVDSTSRHAEVPVVRPLDVPRVPGRVVLVAAYGFTLAAFCLLCGGGGMLHVIALNEGTSDVMGGSVDHEFNMAMMVMFAHLVFGVVVFTAGIGLLRKARWGWITTLVSCGYAAALTCGHLATTVLAGVSEGWIAGIMMSFFLVLFGGYAAMSFMTMLSKDVLLLYRAAK